MSKFFKYILNKTNHRSLFNNIPNTNCTLHRETKFFEIKYFGPFQSSNLMVEGLYVWILVLHVRLQFSWFE